MLAFIIPLKSKSQSKHWASDCALLEATLLSLLNSKNKNYKIYLIYYDEPILKINDEKIIFIQYDFPFMSFENTPAALETEYRSASDKIIVARRWDKSKKIFLGCKKAKEDGCDYIMAVDADDLLSNKLLSYIDKRLTEKKVSGFYINRGFLYRPASKRMIRVDKNMQEFNGSTHILHADLVTIPDFDSLFYKDFNLFTSHGWIVTRLKSEHNIDLERIPFPAVMYVAHGGNISNVSNLNIKEKIKQQIKLIVRGKWVNKEIKKEFCINELYT